MLLRAVYDDRIVMPPPVLSEILSDPFFDIARLTILLDVPLLEIKKGYWERAGLMRAHLIGKNIKPKLPDTLIAQSCIDHDVPLLTRDKGFAVFTEHCGLKLQKPA